MLSMPTHQISMLMHEINALSTLTHEIYMLSILMHETNMLSMLTHKIDMLSMLNIQLWFPPGLKSAQLTGILTCPEYLVL